MERAIQTACAPITSKKLIVLSPDEIVKRVVIDDVQPTDLKYIGLLPATEKRPASKLYDTCNLDRAIQRVEGDLQRIYVLFGKPELREQDEKWKGRVLQENIILGAEYSNRDDHAFMRHWLTFLERLGVSTKGIEHVGHVFDRIRDRVLFANQL